MLLRKKIAFVLSVCVLVVAFGASASNVIELSENRNFTRNFYADSTTKIDDVLPKTILKAKPTICHWWFNNCKNAGKCVEEDGGSYCQCKPGLSGDLCEIVNECVENPLKCGNDTQARCIYNPVNETADCKCMDGYKAFDFYKKTCTTICKTSENCPKFIRCRKNRENDRKFCDCPFGKIGNDCLTKYDECKANGLDCGTNPNVICVDDGRGKPMCDCEEGWNYAFNYEVKDCVNCNCGGNDIGCLFLPGGEKTCYCRDLYSQKNGKCEKCDCGSHSLNCSFQNGEKVCSCYRNYIQFNGTCRRNCSASDENPPCQHGGSCVKDVCQCLPGTDGDECEIVDECQYYWQIHEKCGKSWDVYCIFNETSLDTYCGCIKTGYIYFEKNCKQNCTGLKYPCRNGGECVDGSCRCMSGTSGDWCDVVDVCRDKYGYLKCGSAPCRYDQKTKDSYCLCEEADHLYDPSTMRCKECDCGSHGSCSFLNGEKICNCTDGFAEVLSPWLQTKRCEICDCGPHGTCSFNERGRKVCSCKNGYSEKIGRCVECECGSNMVCGWNVTGKKTCNCREGYGLKNGECTECMCYWNHLNVNCTFPNGKQKCTCPDGYEESMRNYCLDINECTNTSVCPTTTKCTNTPGNYTCTCKKGFRPVGDKLDPKHFGCKDIDECKEQNECPYRDTSECINTLGSYHCICKVGYYTHFSTVSIEYVGCQKDQGMWKIGYAILISVFGVISIGLMIAICKKRFPG